MSAGKDGPGDGLGGGRLLLATHNAGKLEEVRALLAPRGVEVVGAGDLGLPEPAETAGTFEGNARIKAEAAARATGMAALADDSGLEVEALGGLPGVRTADWAEGPGGASGGRDWGRAMGRVHDALIAAGAPEPWRARFVSVLALATPDGGCRFFEGAAEGRLLWPPRGADGHGYDPMFAPDGGDGRTFAEMTLGEKNALSHRARSMRAFAQAVLGAAP